MGFDNHYFNFLDLLQNEAKIYINNIQIASTSEIMIYGHFEPHICTAKGIGKIKMLNLQLPVWLETSFKTCKKSIILAFMI